jgi:hypothetical protein
VSTDTTTASSDVETIDIKDVEGDVQSPKATTAASPRGQAAETPHPAPRAQGEQHRAPTHRAMSGQTRE